MDSTILLYLDSGTPIIFSPTVTAIAPDEEKGKGVGVYLRLGFGIVNYFSSVLCGVRRIYEVKLPNQTRFSLNL